MRFPGNVNGRYKGVSGIYKITNLINMKVYVGQASDLDRRFHNYMRDYYDFEHTRPIIQAMREYGHEFFEFEVICECPRNRLSAEEEFWVMFYMATDGEYGYNVQAVRHDMDYSKTNIDYRRYLSKVHTGLKESNDTKRKKSNKIFVFDEERNVLYIFDSAALFGSMLGISKDLVKNCLRGPCRYQQYRCYYYNKKKRLEIIDRQKHKYYKAISQHSRNWDKFDTKYIELGDYIDSIADSISVETTVTPDGKYPVKFQTYENTIQLNYNMPRKDLKSRVPVEACT